MMQEIKPIYEELLDMENAIETPEEAKKREELEAKKKAEEKEAEEKAAEVDEEPKPAEKELTEAQKK
jgi:hypothetical protein